MKVLCNICLSVYRKYQIILQYLLFIVVLGEDLSPDELQMRRTQLLNQQQLQMATLEKGQQNEKSSMQKGAMSDWELRYAKAKLELKEKHYMV